MMRRGRGRGRRAATRGARTSVKTMTVGQDRSVRFRRKDREGDTAMADSRRTTGSSAAPYARSVLRQRLGVGEDRMMDDLSQPTVRILITGLKNVNMDQLKNFLITHCSIQLYISEGLINFGQMKMEFSRCFITVANQEQANALVALNGMWFKDQQISIRMVNKRSALANVAAGSNLGQLLGKYISSVYDDKNKLLDLSAINTKLPGVHVDFNQMGTMKLLWNVISKKCPQVATVNFAHNNIRQLGGFVFAADQCPSIANLSFEGNKLKEWRELDYLKNLKLRDIVLANNPVSAQVDPATYQNEVGRRFIGLRFLDTNKITPIISFPIPSYVISCELPPLKPSFSDSAVTKDLAIAFVKSYYQVFDGKRDDLIEAYSDMSYFSLSTSPPSTNPGRQALQQFFPFSRNLLKCPMQTKRLELLYTGRLQIVQGLLKLPPMSHVLSHFVMDAHIINLVGNQLLCVYLYGTLQSGGLNCSFHRVFVLTPAAQQSRASAAGWPAQIVNDQLHIFEDTGLHVALSIPATDQVAMPPSIATSPGGVPMSPPDVQLVMLNRLMQETALTPEFARQCLEQNGWDYATAFKNFADLKAQNLIPVMAFRTQ